MSWIYGDKAHLAAQRKRDQMQLQLRARGVCVIPDCSSPTLPISTQGHGLCDHHIEQLKHGPLQCGGVSIRRVS